MSQPRTVWESEAQTDNIEKKLSLPCYKKYAADAMGSRCRLLRGALTQWISASISTALTEIVLLHPVRCEQVNTHKEQNLHAEARSPNGRGGHQHV